MYKMSSKLFLLCKLTNACNQSCVHCFTDACSGGVVNLSLEDVKRVLDDAITIGNDTVVSFIGGEATVWGDFYTLMSDEKYRNAVMKKVNTNGTAIPDDCYKVFKDANFFEVRLSLDSDVPYEHDYLRGAGTHEKTVSSIKKLKELGITVSTGTVISRLNYKKIPEIITFIQSLGITNMHFFTYVSVGRGTSHDELVLTEEERNQVCEEIAKFEKKGYVRPLSLCGEGTCYFNVANNGDCFINFCNDELQKKKLGNIHEKSFFEMYTEEMSKPEYDIIDCSKCPYYSDPIMCSNMHSFCIADLDIR